MVHMGKSKLYLIKMHDLCHKQGLLEIFIQRRCVFIKNQTKLNCIQSNSCNFLPLKKCFLIAQMPWTFSMKKTVKILGNLYHIYIDVLIGNPWGFSQVFIFTNSIFNVLLNAELFIISKVVFLFGIWWSK